MAHGPPEKQNPRRVDRHPQQARVKQRRFIEDALNGFTNIKLSQIVKTNSGGATETALSAALREAVRRKAMAS
jgi:hypothetical protein